MRTIVARQLLLATALAGGTLLAGCNDAATTAVVENTYPAATVFKVWWVTTLFPSPVAPGASSETERTVPGDDFAYALLAPSGLPDAQQPPANLVALKSTEKIAAAEHDLLTITVSDDRFAGNCASGSVLSDEDAQLIVQRIFPGDFAGQTYDPATCASAPAP
jgi:hypothetical protein